MYIQPNTEVVFIEACTLMKGVSGNNGLVDGGPDDGNNPAQVPGRKAFF